VLVQEEEIIAAGHNAPIASHDATAHAEIAVLRAAGQALGSYRLTGTTLYVTLEPCVMCASAMVHARVRRLVFGAWDPRAGGAGSVINAFALPGLNHRVDVFGGAAAAVLRAAPWLRRIGRESGPLSFPEHPSLSLQRAPRKVRALAP
jgi:tRNA(adenine34) deaminase